MDGTLQEIAEAVIAVAVKWLGLAPAPRADEDSEFVLPGLSAADRFEGPFDVAAPLASGS